jgi:nicotinate phosphoribosyltransferase
MIIKSLLDTDFYKFSMFSAVFHQYPSATVKYKFICRNKGVDLAPYRDEIDEEIRLLCQKRFSDRELAYLASLTGDDGKGLFAPDFINHLRTFQLKYTQIEVYIQAGKLEIMIEGLWVETILFEVFVLSIVNEVYFRRTQPQATYEEGYRRLKAKIELVNTLNAECKEKGLPLFKFCDFGTRRRFSSEWQGVVDAVLSTALPANFVGTSSVYWAMVLGLKPIGTFGHEWLQAHQAMVPIEDSQRAAFLAWKKEYPNSLGIALADIFGIKAFLKDWDSEIANLFTGARQDSGDPFSWGEAFISKNEQLAIDPMTKTGVFSDGLDFPKAIELFNRFATRMLTFFGIGTNLTNDLGFTPLNIVVKMIFCNGKPVCKVSDEPGKAMSEDKDYLAKVMDVLTKLGLV